MFIEKHWKVRGRDCGDVAAAWLTQFMGEPLRQKYLGFKLNEKPNVIFEKGFTSTTRLRRLGDLRGQNIRNSTLSWSVWHCLSYQLLTILTIGMVFGDYNVCTKTEMLSILLFRKTTVCQCLLMSPHSW